MATYNSKPVMNSQKLINKKLKIVLGMVVEITLDFLSLLIDFVCQRVSMATFVLFFNGNHGIYLGMCANN